MREKAGNLKSAYKRKDLDFFQSEATLDLPVVL